MYHTTGLARDDVIEVCGLVHAECLNTPGHTWPPILGLFKSIVVTLTYLRRNRVQAELAESFAVSQSTISRAIAGLTPVLGRVLAGYVPVAEDLDPSSQYIVDGTLLPCWSWADHPELYSGKHKTTGLNVQVACDLSGRLAWISDPVDGRRHDTAALRISGVLDDFDANHWMGDKGYVGNDIVTPIRNRLAVTCWSGRSNSTRPSTGFGTRSSGPSPTSRPGGSCTPITAGPSPRSLRPSQRSLLWSFTRARE